MPANIISIEDFAFKTWLDLVYPDNKVGDIFFKETTPVKTIPDNLDFEIQKEENSDIKINVIFRTMDGKSILIDKETNNK